MDIPASLKKTNIKRMEKNHGERNLECRMDDQMDTGIRISHSGVCITKNKSKYQITCQKNMTPDHCILDLRSREMKRRKEAKMKKRRKRRTQSKTSKKRRMTIMRRHFIYNILHRKDPSFVAQPDMHIFRVEAPLEVTSQEKGRHQWRGGNHLTLMILTINGLFNYFWIVKN